MKVHLDSDIFDIVRTGIKDVEVRLNDEKRQKLKVGDTLTFYRRPNDDEIINKVVKELVYFNTFEEVVNNYKMKRIYLENCTKEDYLKLMYRFYTKESETNYGVVAIEFE